MQRLKDGTNTNDGVVISVKPLVSIVAVMRCHAVVIR